MGKDATAKSRPQAGETKVIPPDGDGEMFDDEADEIAPEGLGDGNAPAAAALVVLGGGKRSKRPLSREQWQGVAERFLEIRHDILQLRSDLSGSCTQQEVACLDSVIDKMGIAMIRLDVVAYKQLGVSGSGLFLDNPQ